MRIPRSNSENWREYPERGSSLPAAAARDAIRTGDVASAAEAYLLQAAFESGTTERQSALTAADICATLKLADAVQEATAALKALATRPQLKEVA